MAWQELTRHRLYHGQITAAEINERQSDNRTARVKGEDGEGTGDYAALQCVCFHSLHETDRSLTLLRLQVTIINKGPSVVRSVHSDFLSRWRDESDDLCRPTRPGPGGREASNILKGKDKFTVKDRIGRIGPKERRRGELSLNSRNS